MKRLIILLLAILGCLSLYASLMWENAVPIRQGVNIEWFRTGSETADGCAIYVWSDTKLGERDLYAQKVNAQGQMVWGQPLLVDGKPDRQEDPVITRTSDDNFVIAWIDFSDDLDGSVYAQKVSSAGQLMWQTGGVPVCVVPGIQISLNIEPDNTGGAYIIWEDSRNPSKDLYGQHLNGSGNAVWATNGIPIANGEGDESYNTMWADGTGGLMIGYVYALAGAEDLYVKRFLPNGTMAWAQPLALCTQPDKQNKIKMAPINNDSFVFTWMDQRNVDPDIYAQRVSINGQTMWPQDVLVYGDATNPNPKPQENPRVVATSDNNVIIVWEDKRNNYDDPDLFAQKLNLSGQRQWAVTGVPVSVADFGQRGPRMEADNAGGCYMVWDDTRNGNTPNVDIYAQHVSSTGASLWTANGLPICTAPNEQSNCLIKISNNNIYINWMDMRTGSLGIDYQVLNLSGQPQLADNGVEVFWGLSGDAAIRQVAFLPRQNDAIAIWQDTRYANLGYQIFFQIIKEDGTYYNGMEMNGRGVTTLTNHDQQDPSAAVTPDGKTCVVWEEKRGENPKIFAQLLDIDGTRLWGEQGIELTDASPLRQKDAKVVYDAAANCFYIGWSNYDTVYIPEPTQYYHIYGQKMLMNGTKQWGADGVLISGVPAGDNMFECELNAMLSTNGAFGPYFVWTRTSTNPDTQGYMNVCAKLVDANGATAAGWANEGLRTSTYNDYDTKQYLPKAALSNAGIFVTWLDFRGDFMKTLYGQLISPAGQLLWNPLGVAMSDANNEQDQPTVIAEEHITFAWMESVTASNQDIAIQRYNLSGTPINTNAWHTTPNYVVSVDTTQANPYLAKFSNGGMVVAWSDYRGELPDIYARYVESDGNWGTQEPTEFVVCDELKKQSDPIVAVVHDTTPNTAFIIWSDGRSSGKTDIIGLYVQRINNQTTVANDDNVAVNGISLKQNYPNPFNPETTISFSLDSKVKKCELAVYNLKGEKVKTLHSGLTEKGRYSFTWNGKDSNDKNVASGVYFYKLTTDKKTQTRKMVLMK